MPSKSRSSQAQRYTVIRDTREKDQQGWSFAPSKNCAGTIDGALPTGDYTIEGYEELIVVERKGSIAEFAGDLFDARFLAELDRMRAFRHAFLVLEFGMDDVLAWPGSSGIPPSRRADLDLTNYAFVRRITEIQQLNPTIQFMFVGPVGGKAFVASHFARVLEAEARRAKAP